MKRRQRFPKWLPEVIFGVTCGVLGSFLSDHFSRLGDVLLIIGGLVIVVAGFRRLQERRRRAADDQVNRPW